MAPIPVEPSPKFQAYPATVPSESVDPEPFTEAVSEFQTKAKTAYDKGTELAARLRVPEPTGSRSAVARASGDGPRQRVRSALREAKQLIEVGEVLRVDPSPHGHRTASVTGSLVEAGTRRAAGEGVL